MVNVGTIEAKNATVFNKERSGTNIFSVPML